MELLSFLAKFLLAQCVLVAIIVVVLKKKLDNRLVDLAIRRLEFLSQAGQSRPAAPVLVVSHKDLKLENKERILKAVTRYFEDPVKPVFKTDKNILGGIIITAGEETLEYSLRNRLRLAVLGREGA